MNYKAAIFDFDGTIFDTGKGITECVAIALNELGYPPLSQNDLNSFIGPSLYDSFNSKCGIEGKNAETAIQVFRKHYHADGIYKSHIYEGILDLLKDLKFVGIKIAIASSKPQIMIEKLLEKHNLFSFFDSVIGADGAEKKSGKEKAITDSVMALGLDKSQCVMIGDRKFDVNSAKSVGVDSIYVLYGYGSEDEMKACQPTYFAIDVNDLREILNV